MENAVEYIQSIPPFTYPLGNDNLKKLLVSLGSPEKELKIIHIAGTNGKGSVAAMLGEILKNQGYCTGVFTSPYLIEFNERIRLNGVNISDSELLSYTRKIKTAMEKEDAFVSQFAFILACALLYYKDKKAQYVILEAGMGGRLDATNVIEESLVSVITSIGLDHTDYLGNTIEEIAREKAGIIKRNGTVVSYRNEESAINVIWKKSNEMNADLFIADKAESIKDGAVINGVKYELGLKGSFQANNAAVAVKVVEALKNKGVEISDVAFYNGLSKCKWRARFEKVRENVIVDGGHNPDGIKAMINSITQIPGEKLAVVAMMEDKDTDECMKLISKAFDKVIVTELKMPRCIKAEKLKEKLSSKAEVVIAKDLYSAFLEAENFMDGTAVICGSIYLAGEALKYFDR